MFGCSNACRRRAVSGIAAGLQGAASEPIAACVGCRPPRRPLSARASRRLGGHRPSRLQNATTAPSRERSRLSLLHDHPHTRSARPLLNDFDASATSWHRSTIRTSLGLHDAGVTAEGQPWLALEFVEGRTVTDWCDRDGWGRGARSSLSASVAGRGACPCPLGDPSRRQAYERAGHGFREFACSTSESPSCSTRKVKRDVATALTRQGGPPLTPDMRVRDSWRSADDRLRRLSLGVSAL